MSSSTGKVKPKTEKPKKVTTKKPGSKIVFPESVPVPTFRPEPKKADQSVADVSDTLPANTDSAERIRAQEMQEDRNGDWKYDSNTPNTADSLAPKKEEPPLQIPTGAELTPKNVLKLFHQTFCNNQSADNKRDNLMKNWEEFQKHFTTPQQKEVVQKALELDIVARTVMYEGHGPAEVLPHRFHKPCEMDIIILSMRNRFEGCKAKNKKYYGCNEDNLQLQGIATANSKSKSGKKYFSYNAWNDKEVKRTWITSCFLRQDQDAKEFVGISKKETQSYSMRRNQYLNAVEHIPAVMGYDHSPEERSRGDYLTKMFEISNADGEKVTPEQQKEYLSKIEHYYHARGLQKCDVERQTKFLKLSSANISFADKKSEKKPVTNVEVILTEKKDKKGYSFMVFREGRDRQRDLVSGESIYGPGAVITDFDQSLIDKAEFTCLPKGLVPGCMGEKEYRTESSGLRIPTGWLDPETQRDIKSNLNMGAEKKENKNAGGKHVGIRCLNPNYSQNGMQPSFGGRCDKLFNPVTEVEQ